MQDVSPQEVKHKRDSRSLVPFVPNIDFKARIGLDQQPLVTPLLVKNAMELIYSLRGEPEFSHPDDAAVFQIVQEYLGKVRQFPYTMMRVQLTGAARAGRMGYSCVDHVYALQPGLRANPMFFAATVYHEVQHEAECLAKMKEMQVSTHSAMRDYWSLKDRCETELPAYAAGTRFVAAMLRKGILQQLSLTKEDASSLNSDIAAWKMLRKGTTHFCQWLQAVHRGKDAGKTIFRAAPAK